MRSMFALLCLALICCMTLCIDSTVYSQDNPLPKLWTEMQKAMDNSLPKTAKEKLVKIYEYATKNNQTGDMIKSKFYLVMLDMSEKAQGAETEKDAQLAFLNKYEEEIKIASPKMKPFLKLMLANWYWSYYEKNSYRYRNRTRTNDYNEKDFSTWDLPKLFNEIGTSYESLLADEAMLKEIEVNELSSILIKGNQPLSLRPTLFDFFAHEALTFYCNEEQNTLKPENAFEIDSTSPALMPYSDFAKWEPKTSDNESPLVSAVKVFQRLLKHNKDTNNIDGFIDNELMRLNWAYQAAVGEGIREKYIDTLEKLADEFSTNPYSGIALALIGSEYRNMGENVKALEYAEKVIKLFPKTYGEELAKELKSKILSKAVSIETEKIITPNKTQAKVSYRNINKLYFRLIERKEDDLTAKNSYNPDSIDYSMYHELLNRPVLKEWNITLPKCLDYKDKTEFVELPIDKIGLYYLFASVNPDFSDNDNAMCASVITASKLTFFTRKKDGKNELIAVDSISGIPLKNAEVKVFTYNYNYNNNKRAWINKSSGKTDNNGNFQFGSFGDHGLIVVKHGNDLVYKTDYFNVYGNRDYDTIRTIQFFTDRSIYRPGQTIHYKGIAYSYNKTTNKYQTLNDNSVVKVTLYDKNRKSVLTLNHNINKFGSFNGTFTAPTDRLTGVYTIKAVVQGSNYTGNTSISIEEYKRPKFKVSIDKPKTEFKLGDEVSLKGTAIGYNGAFIDDAKVSFRVTRRVRFPYWCWWIMPISSYAEIAHGKVTTDNEGKFEIKFIALPDRSIDPKNDPVFSYEISADVTDSNGETRSGSTIVRLGYTAMEISLICPEEYEAKSAFEIKVNTNTLNDEPVSAKGNIKIYSLIQPNEPVRKSYFNDQTTLKTNKSDPRNWEIDKLIKNIDFTTNNEGNTKCVIDGLPEGGYRIIATSNDKYGKEVKSEKTLLSIDSKSKTFGIKIPFYAKSITVNLQPGDTYEAVWATGYSDGPAFIEVEHKGKLLQSYWTCKSIDKNHNNKAKIIVPISEDMRGGFNLRIVQIKDNREYTFSKFIPVNWDNKKLNIKFSRIHSKLEPGQSDTWQIEITGKEAEKNAIEMVAAMYDSSLDAYKKHSWINSFNGVFYSDSARISNTFINKTQMMNQWINDLNDYYHVSSRSYVHLIDEISSGLFNMFGSYRVSRHRRYDSGTRGLIRFNRAVAEDDMMVEEEMAPNMGSANFMTNSVKAVAPVASVKSVAKVAVSGQSISSDSFDKDTVEEKKDESSNINLDKVSARTNLNETAFFYPNLIMNNENSVIIEFKVPEALTTWKFMGFAHGTGLQSGSITAETITQKDLMIEPNAPRFLREGDKLAFSTKITNLSEKKQSGKISLTISDPVTEKPLNKEFAFTAEQNFSVEAGKSTSVSWTLNVPDMAGLVKYKVVGSTGKLSDGEEGWLPILSRYLFVTESMPMPINGPAKKVFNFKKLLDSEKSTTLKHKALTLEVTSNPAWYAVQALPYLMEYPYECSEQTFNRYYANLLAAHIANSDPKIKRVFEVWRRMEPLGGKALISNLEKNQELKAVALQETPWVMDAENETAQKHRIGLLFEDNKLKEETTKCVNKLKQMQNSDGGFPWFPGFLSSDYITLYIMTGFGRMNHLGIKADMVPAIKTLSYLDNMLVRRYNEIRKNPDYLKINHISPFYAMYLYGRTFYTDNYPIEDETIEAYEFFTDQAEKYWQTLPRMSQAHIAIALHRMKRDKIPAIIMQSLMERSSYNEEMGRFWKDSEFSLSWYRADIECQAMMIEAFTEISKDEKAVDECKVWLIKQKQTQQWKSTKATADAIYSLILRGADILAADKLVIAEVGNTTVKPEQAEAGTGYYKTVWSGGEVKPEMGKVTLNKEEKGVAWGALHWQYLEDISKITGHENNLKLEKRLFIKQNTSKGPTISEIKNGKVNVGDLVTVRIILRTDRDMEFVHMKDGRGSGMEPVNVLSQMKYQDGLRYYEATKDTATNFFIDYLPKGTYVFEYDLRVQHAGEYQTGMAEIQCMYAPEFNSHSNSIMLKVSK